MEDYDLLKSNSSLEDSIDNITKLLEDSWRFRSSEEFIKFFDFIARFNHYSRYNSMMVYIQNSSVTFFGGRSYWKKHFDRNIKPYARPYIILAPNGPIMLVYDIFDTEGIESPEEFLKNGLGHKPFEVKGSLEKGVLNYVIEEAKNWGIKMSYKPLSYFNAGYITTICSSNLEICLKEGMNTEEDFSALLHEISHLFLGHTGHKELYYKDTKRKIKIAVRRLSKTAEELEAETISFLICKKLGLESSSVDYLAGYIKKEEDLQEFDFEHVIKTTDRIEGLFIKFIRKFAEIKSTPETNFIPVEGGVLKIGLEYTKSAKDSECNIMLPSFYMGKYEVTQKEWQTVMGDNPSLNKGDDKPVESITWYQAVEFCNKLSQIEGLIPCYTINGENVTCNFNKNGYRLPTETEWEFAARGGNKSKGYMYSGSNSLDEVGWYEQNSNQTENVGKKKGNELGIQDMSGNIWEWCWDSYGKHIISIQTNQTGDSTNLNRVLRGGSVYLNSSYCSVFNRGGYYATHKGSDIGFRLTRTSI